VTREGNDGMWRKRKTGADSGEGEREEEEEAQESEDEYGPIILHKAIWQVLSYYTRPFT
jgi:hypothetical protein